MSLTNRRKSPKQRPLVSPPGTPRPSSRMSCPRSRRVVTRPQQYQESESLSDSAAESEYIATAEYEGGNDGDSVEEPMEADDDGDIIESEDPDEGYGNWEDDLDEDHLDLARTANALSLRNAATDLEVVYSVQLPDQATLDDEGVLYGGNTRPAKEWRQLVMNLDEEPFARKDYSAGTERLIRNAEKEWELFCTKILGKNDPKSIYQGVSFRAIYCFLDWKLCQRISIMGRTKQGFGKRSSLGTFWCAFRLAFERAAEQKIDRFGDYRKMTNAIANLCKAHKLSAEKRENRPMTLDNPKPQLDTTLRTMEKTFKLGEQRILAILFLLLLAPAGSRPASILQLRFGDIEVALRRDPTDPIKGPRRLLIRFTLKFTKRYLGPKASKAFYIPEMIYEPNFLLNSHVFLLGILFRHRAFRAEGLNDNPHARISKGRARRLWLRHDQQTHCIKYDVGLGEADRGIDRIWEQYDML
ncbi:hypothetical protein F5B21DRAFT_523079 [Xylaria acuta]|nr:hypothetical protein F5B21DRAFT_523079 [Xylaria acuta]